MRAIKTSTRRSSLGLAAVVLGLAGTAAAQGPTTPIEEVVMYGVDADTNKLLRYAFDTDTFIEVGEVTDQYGTVVEDIECLGFIPSGSNRGLYGVTNFHEVPGKPSTLVKINPVDASAYLYPDPVGFLKVEGMVAVPPGGPLDDFDIAGGAVDPAKPFTVTATVLGAAISYGGAYDLPVTVRLIIGDNPIDAADQFEPWGPFDLALAGNVNDGNNPREWTATGMYPASGATVSLQARSWRKKKSWYSGNSENHWEIRNEISSWGDTWNTNVPPPPPVIVLRDGDEVPPVDGFQDQPSIVDFLLPYIDTTTGPPFTVKLKPHEVIFLVELGLNTVGHSAIDYQDLVVLVSLAEGAGDEWTLWATRKNSADNTDRQLIEIDPQTGTGTVVMDGIKRFTGLARDSTGKLWATRRDNDVWTVEPDLSDPNGGVDTLIGSNPYLRLEALEFCFGDDGGGIAIPGVPDSWSTNGTLFGFSDTSNQLLVVNPQDGAAIEYPGSFSTVDCEGLVFLTRRTDPFWAVFRPFD